MAFAIVVARGEVFMAQFSVITYEYPGFKTADHSQSISSVEFYLRYERIDFQILYENTLPENL